MRNGINQIPVRFKTAQAFFLAYESGRIRDFFKNAGVYLHVIRQLGIGQLILIDIVELVEIVRILA